MNYIFIGNGIISLSTAFRLIKNLKGSDKIIILGKGDRPGSATLAAPAMLNSFCEIEHGYLDYEFNRIRFKMNREATKMWPAFLNEINKNITKDFLKNNYIDQNINKGTFLINNASADLLDDINYEAIISSLNQFNEPYDEIKARDIPGYKPSQRNRSNRAIYINNEGWVNSQLTLNNLELILKNSTRVAFIDDNVSKIITKNNDIDYIVTSKGKKIFGDKYILVSGASVTDLLYDSKIDIKIPRVFYGIGASINLENIGGQINKCIRTPNRGLACGIYTVPFKSNIQNQKLTLGATNYISTKPIFKARANDVQSLLNSLINQINAYFYKSIIYNVNVGHRPTSLDTFPLIGETSIKSLIIGTGTKRDGFHLSPLISKILKSTINGEKKYKVYDCFKPERNPINTFSREEGIIKAIDHMMSAMYQHNFEPGIITTKSKLYDHIKQDLEKLHDKVGAYNWGIPTEMLDMYRYNHQNY